MRSITSRVDVGRVRKRNEDFILVDPTLGLAIVADGVGGHQAGDRAARLAAEACAEQLRNQRWAVESVRAHDKRVDREELAKFVRHALKTASKRIFTEAAASSELAGMSSTCTLFLDLGSFALIAHVGDSRAYLVRETEVAQLTTDHVVMTLGQSDDAVKQVKRRVLARAVGHTPDVEVDVSWVVLRPDDALVLCSDGLSDLLATPNELHECLEIFGTAAAPDVLVDLANVRGGRDNISAVVIGQEGSALGTERWASIREQLDILRELSPFQSLSYLELEQLRPSAHVDNLPATSIVAYPEATPMLAVVVRGSVDLTYASGDTITVGVGGLIGETSLSLDGAWPYVVLTREDVTLVTFPASQLRRLLETRPRASSGVIWEFLSVLASRTTEIGQNAVHRVQLAREAW